MAKSVIVELDVDMPLTEMQKKATVTIEGRTYTGTVQVIAAYPDQPNLTKVTLVGPGLAVATSAPS